MKKLKAYILDDELGSIKSLIWELENFKDEVEILASSTDALGALEEIGQLSPDILFLDIEMPVLNGFDFLKRLGNVTFDVVFTTAYDEFALQAFEVSAVDYLLKPIDKISLERALGRVKERKNDNQILERLNNLFTAFERTGGSKKKIAVPDMEGLHFIEIDKIHRCESSSNYCHIFFKDQKMTVSKTLKEIEGMLPGNQFIRIHNSHLVNIDKVSRYRKGKDGAIVMEDGTVLPVSRSKKQFFSSN